MPDAPGSQAPVLTDRPAPTRLLLIGLLGAVLTVGAVGVYTIREIHDLRDEQTAISDRNRKDSLQLLRIQNDLSSLAVLTRDMADRTQPYPLEGWRPAFDRVRSDLSAAVGVERTVAPPDRPAAQQRRLEAGIDEFWRSIDTIFARARAGQDEDAIQLLHGPAVAAERELDALVSQFLVANLRTQEDAARANRTVYDRVSRDIAVLVAVLIVVFGTTGAWIVAQNRRAFDDVREISEQLRTLSWHTLRLQEDLQRSMSRELHDDFGQIVTAIGTLLGRARRHVAADAPLVAELDAVRDIAQQALDRIRTQSQWLHPGLLDDFGLQKALERAVEQFERQTGIRTSLTVDGALEHVSPDFAIHIYRIVQEALNNVARHSGSRQADVRLACAGGALRVEVRDRGNGLPPTLSRGLGLVSMRERAELMGGHLRVQQAAEGGVSVEMDVPDVTARAVVEGARA